MNNEIESAASGLLAGIRRHANFAIGIGILFSVLGVVAVAAPLATGVAITLMVGVALIVGGIGKCMLAFRVGALGHGLLILLLGLVTLLAGGFLVFQPVAGLVSITLILAAYFLVTGALAIITSLNVRPASGWGLMLGNGIVTLVLGLLIWQQWPLSGTWALGVLFGVQLLMMGLSLIALGSSVRGEFTAGP